MQIINYSDEELFITRGEYVLKKEYLLDTNIVIKIWNRYNKLFQRIEENKEIDFVIYHNVDVELSTKEFKEVNGAPVLSDRFLKLLEHIITEVEIDTLELSQKDVSIKYNDNKSIFYINGNKLSKNDYCLICICEKNNKYTLVTEDKKIIKSAKYILDKEKIMGFHEFIEDLKKFDILNEM